MEYLAFAGTTGWLPLAYYNVYKQDGYLTPFTTCKETNQEVCEVERPRNMFISRALRAVRCPVLGRANSACAKEKKGPTTWLAVLLFLIVGTFGSINVFKSIQSHNRKSRSRTNTGTYNFWFPSLLSVAISVLLFGLLEVPYGSAPYESKKYHLMTAISAFALMIINSFYLSIHASPRRKTIMYALTIGLCLTALMAGTSEAVVDNNIPDVTSRPHGWYEGKQWHRRLIDSAFQLGENLPVILYGIIIVVASLKS